MPKGPSVDQQPLLPSTVLTGVSCLKQLTRQGKEIITILFFWHETEAQGQTEELTIETRLLIKKKCQANNLRSSPSLNMNSLIITSNSCSISIPHPKSCFQCSSCRRVTRAESGSENPVYFLSSSS